MKNRYAISSEYVLARYCNRVNIPHKNSMPGTNQFIGNNGNRNANGIWPMTEPTWYIVWKSTSWLP